jgi:glycosyltransferase involved in cell wall biosynthesis
MEPIMRGFSVKRILYLSRGGFIDGSQRQLSYVVTHSSSYYKPILVCNFARQFDIALVHSSDIWLSGYLLWVAKRLKVPSVLHVRAPISTGEIRKHRCGKATAVIAISRRITRNLLAAGIEPEKVIQIDDGVDLRLFGPEGSEENVLRRDFSPAGEVLIGLVGRTEPAKRQREFLCAAEQVVRDKSRSVTFFVIGSVRSDSYFKELQRFVAEGELNGRTLFTGRREDMPEVLRSLDILVSLSGGSIMFEAMSCGKPVVLAGFSRELASVHIQDGRTGLLVESAECAALTQALIRLMDEPELRKEIGREARKWVEDKLSHVDMAARTQRVYDELLQE